MLSQFILDQSLSTDWTRARAFHALGRWLARRHDPVVRYRLHGRTLALNLSHDLPWNRRVHPTYSDNLRRLAAFVRSASGGLCMVDVGANIGDSHAMTCPEPGDDFLLVEGDPHYFELLVGNTHADPGVTRVRALLSDRDGSGTHALVIEGGNARVANGAPAGAVSGEVVRARVGGEFRTLDQVVAEHPRFRATNLIKTDVEGFDPRVLRGARRLIAEAAPVILFEHHPVLVSLAGEDDRAVFTELLSLGYGTVLVYDHLGHLIGPVACDDAERLGSLCGEARRREGSYYDVCAFPDRHAAQRDRFLEAERAVPTGAS